MAETPSPTLDKLIRASSLQPSPRNAAVTHLAAAAQEWRFKNGASNRTDITRSTTLWALMTVDSHVEKALTSAGVDIEALADMLALARAPVFTPTEDAFLDHDLAGAVRTHLDSLPKGTEYGPAELATAILRSATVTDSGLLGGRLAKLGIDYGTALAALERRASPTALPETDPPTWSEASPDDSPSASTGHSSIRRGGAGTYSESVRRARERVGTSDLVTAAAVAAAIQSLHPEYGDGLFGAVKLRLSLGRRQSVDTWLAQVADLYDLAAVAASRHKVINGELAVLGLAELDPYLAEDLRGGGVLVALRRSVEVRPHPTTDRTGWSSDSPAVEDLLGRRYLAQALAKRLRARQTEDSFLVHIDGPWGSGKTTLFHFLTKELASDSLVVNINAWREQQVGVQWWTLHHALRAAVEDEAVARAGTALARARAGLRAKLRSRVDVIRVRLFPFVVAVMALAAVLIVLFFIANFDLSTGAQVADAVAKVTSLALLTVGGVTAAYRFLLPESGRSAKAFVANSPNPMAEVRLLFQRTLRRAGKRVVFLIDDLDRCEDAYIVELLTTVQTLLRDAHETSTTATSAGYGPCAFIAADGQWIRSSYENHYEAVHVTEVPGRPLGYMFLEKIFQLHVRLPSIRDEDKAAFYESLLMPGRVRAPASAEEQQTVARIAEQVRQATTGPDIAQAARAARTIADPERRLEVLGNAAVRFSELTIQDQTHHELAPYARFMEPNPRSIRLFVNTYGTLQSLRTLEGVPVRTSPLARWTVIEIRWPLLADHLRTRPDDIEPRPESELSSTILDLLASRDVQEVITGLDGEGLSADDIRQCTGAEATR